MTRRLAHATNADLLMTLEQAARELAGAMEAIKDQANPGAALTAPYRLDSALSCISAAREDLDRRVTAEDVEAVASGYGTDRPYQRRGLIAVDAWSYDALQEELKKLRAKVSEESLSERLDRVTEDVRKATTQAVERGERPKTYATRFRETLGERKRPTVKRASKKARAK